MASKSGVTGTDPYFLARVLRLVLFFAFFATVLRPKSARNSSFARSSTLRCEADRPLPPRLMWKFSIDIAERKGALLRRRLRSAERFRDRATAPGFFLVKTPRSRTSALLFCMTRADQRRLWRNGFCTE